MLLANKQDLPNALSIEEISKILQLNLIRNRDYKIFGVSAMTSDGLTEAFDWMSLKLKENRHDTLVIKLINAFCNIFSINR